LNRLEYDRDQVEKILGAYRTLFPDTGGELARYWDTGRRRDWSYVTTDFHNATYDNFKELTVRTDAIDKNMKLGKAEKGEALRKTSTEVGVGFSLGICPWTDNLLFETYAPEKDRMIILLGHDWYPIVPRARATSDVPLELVGLHHLPKKNYTYKTGVPDVVITNTNESPVVLFLNLYPDYRPPGTPSTGLLPKGSYSYEDCLLGLDAVIASVSRRYQSINLISWGVKPWETLGTRVKRDGKQSGIMKQTSERSGEKLTFKSSNRYFNYLPMAHPSKNLNFRKPSHLCHIVDGFDAMGLGTPWENPNCFEADRTAMALWRSSSNN
jgi:hypothetical protein